MREYTTADFWALVNKDGECWLWLGDRNTNGMPIIGFRGGRWKARRLAYFLTYGKLPAAKLFSTCRNVDCVRPDHLQPPSFPPIICENCGKSFVIHRGPSDRAIRRFCSKSCSKRYISKSQDSFWSKVNKSDGCWEWTRCCIADGYGVATHQGKRWLAHRLAYTLTYGPIPDGLIVCHSCDNPHCCRPDHLFLGTITDNAQDRDRKNRGFTPRGEQQGKAKLCADDVRAIRLSSESPRVLAERYNVSPALIYVVRKRMAWKHITD